MCRRPKKINRSRQHLLTNMKSQKICGLKVRQAIRKLEQIRQERLLSQSSTFSRNLFLFTNRFSLLPPINLLTSKRRNASHRLKVLPTSSYSLRPWPVPPSYSLSSSSNYVVRSSRGLRLGGTETRKRNVAILGYRREKRSFFIRKNLFRNRKSRTMAFPFRGMNP